jgi:hypothetical protein
MTMKKMMTGLMFLAFAGAAAQTNAPAADVKPADVTVSRSAVCTAIQDREPSGTQETGEYKAEIGVIYFWSEIMAKDLPGAVKHRWSQDGKQVFEIELSLKNPRTRTWSTKKIAPGAWKVEVVSASGEVLKSAEFKIVP